MTDGKENEDIFDTDIGLDWDDVGATATSWDLSNYAKEGF